MRYYFHLVSRGDAILDDTGIEVADLVAAEAEALQAVQEIRQEDEEADELWQGWQLNITDLVGRVLLSIPLDTPPQQQLLWQSEKRFASCLLRH